MRIQHNIMSMNAYRNYGNNTSALSKNLEKLSSGYKINRAGDDAAGLAISEKMRAQIKGLEAAQKNVKDGISLVKTAEGAMQEIQDMLSRMKYLATQSANGTYDEEVDRQNLQAEVDKLNSEIDRIADSANFNGINLLDGSKNDGAVSISADGKSVVIKSTGSKNDTPTSTATIADMGGVTGAKVTGLAGDGITGVSLETVAGAATGATGSSDDSKIEVSITSGKLTIKLTGAGADKTGATTIDADAITAKIKDAITNDTNLSDDQKKALENIAFEGTVGTLTTAAAADATVAEDEAAAAAEGPTFTENKAGGTDKTLADFGVKSIDFSGVEITEETDIKLEYDADGTKGTLKLTIGDKTYSWDADDTNAALKAADKEVELADADGNKIKVTLAKDQTVVGNDKKADNTDDVAEAKVGTLAPADTNAGGKGLELQIGDTADPFNRITVGIGNMHSSVLKTNTVDISKAASAQTAIDTIKVAINYVSAVRGQLGATQNRLEHTANNLSVMTENITDAESTIRDTDVADEMMAYTKNNILIQSAQAMLAQANAVPQGVLQLLQ